MKNRSIEKIILLTLLFVSPHINSETTGSGGSIKDSMPIDYVRYVSFDGVKPGFRANLSIDVVTPNTEVDIFVFNYTQWKEYSLNMYYYLFHQNNSKNNDWMTIPIEVNGNLTTETYLLKKKSLDFENLSFDHLIQINSIDIHTNSFYVVVENSNFTLNGAITIPNLGIEIKSNENDLSLTHSIGYSAYPDPMIPPSRRSSSEDSSIFFTQPSVLILSLIVTFIVSKRRCLD